MILKHEITLKLDYDSRNSSPTHTSEELFNIDMISTCIINYNICYIKNAIEIKCDTSYSWN